MKRIIPLLVLCALVGCSSDESAQGIAGQAFQAIQKNNLADFKKTLTVEAQTNFGNQETLNRLAEIASTADVSVEHAKESCILLSTTPHSGCFWNSECASSSVEQYQLPVSLASDASKTLATFGIECQVEVDSGHSKYPRPTLRECRIADIQF